MGHLNINEARQARKRVVLFETAKTKHIDVLFLKEMHSDRGSEADGIREYERSNLKP